MNKSDRQKAVEDKIIRHALAAFVDLYDYEPNSEVLMVRIERSRGAFRLTASNDAYARNIEPLDAKGTFDNVKDAKMYLQSKGTDTIIPHQAAREVDIDAPQLYDAEEWLAIYDEAVDVVLAQLISTASKDSTANIRRKQMAISACEIKAEIRRLFKGGAQI